jgi:hypothetical protein
MTLLLQCENVSETILFGDLGTRAQFGFLRMIIGECSSEDSELNWQWICGYLGSREGC